MSLGGVRDCGCQIPLKVVLGSKSYLVVTRLPCPNTSDLL